MVRAEMVRLRSLKLKGFKTFARPTELVFERGVTVIIGPNGSGKSNIADAVLWVLGEQSPQNLRGKTMHDVIFTGAGGYRSSVAAEVSLIFEDENGGLPWGLGELEITRRLSRDSGSSYWLNGSSCRLLDIHEVIGALGLGREMHSVVSQGRVEAFLSSTPEVRRAWVEEAAGLGRFKKRRERAQTKLEKTRQNLLRIADIQKEVEAALRPLRQQVTAAERFAEATEEWALAKTKCLLHSLLEIDEMLKAANVELGRLEDRRQDIEARLHVLEEERRAKEAAFTTALEHREVVTAAWHRSVALAENLEGRVSALRQRLARLEGENDRALRRLELACTQKEALAAREAELSHDRVDEDRLARVAAWAEELSRLHDEAFAAARAFAGREEELKDAVFEAEAARSRALQDREFLRRELEERERVCKELEDAAAQVAARVVSLEEGKRTLAADLETATAALAEARETFAQAVRVRDNAAVRVQESARAEGELVENLSALERRAAVLRDLLDRGEGVPSGAQSLREAGARLLSELITVQPGYERAVAAALGPMAWAVVVSEELTAEEILRHDGALEALRRVPCRHLYVVQGSLPHGARDLWEVLSGPDDLLSLLRCLIPPTAVVEDQRNLTEYSADLDRGWRLVSREGEVVEGSWLVARRREVAAEALLKARNELDVVTRRYRELDRKLAQIRVELEEAREAVDEAERQAALGEKSLSEAEKKVTTLEGELDLNERRLAEVRLQGQEIRTRLQREVELAADLKVEIETAEQTGEEREAELARARSALEDLQREAEETRNRLARLQYKKSQASLLELRLRERCRALEKEKAHLQEQRKVAEQEAARSERRIQWLGRYSPLVGELLQAAERLASLGKAISGNLATAVDEARFVVEKTARESREQGGAEAELQVEYEALGTRITDIRVEKAHLEERRLQLQEELGELRRKHLAPRSVNYDDVIGEEGRMLAAALEKAERKRERIGPVNPLAAQECVQMEERARFLSEQRADLESSVARLQELIRELDSHIEKTFHEVFSATRRHFSDVTAAVFPGARGELRLTRSKSGGQEAEEDEEKWGIDLEVKFPNKAPRTLSLLSGGEKAMTAIAFLFSLFLARPCPFYILDEVEASLDDVNIRRFLSLISKYKDKTQFIIITHQRQTMEVADTLYGVALEKDGTSRVLSRRLTVAKGA